MRRFGRGRPGSWPEGEIVTQQEVSARLRAATGHSAAEEADKAGYEAAMEALNGLGGETPAMIIVYATVRYDLGALLAAVRSVTGDTPLVGESSAGQLREGELMEPGAGVTVLAMTA